MARSNGSTNGVAVTLVRVQTLKGGKGIEDSMATVNKAVKDYNAAQGKNATPHVAVQVEAVPSNRKGMAWQLAMIATLARSNGVTMVRLSVHGGDVALCGPKPLVAATMAAIEPTYNALQTMVGNAYNESVHGNRVGFYNGFLCGVPAGIQVARGIVATIAYGIGYFHDFPAPGNGASYKIGHAAGLVMGKQAAPARKPRTERKPATPTAMAEESTADEAVA